MATAAATKRLTREYRSLRETPPEYITAHPSETNILEWHYILTGPPNTPYEGGQYWGTLTFPPDYPFAPPAIRMFTPSGRFQTHTRLCLSISDFHPKSFNPAWGIQTILVGLMSFMTSEEMTTGSVRASDNERRLLAARSRWNNSTGNGSKVGIRPASSLKSGDGGARFRQEWAELDEENWKWMQERKIDPATGSVTRNSPSCAPGASALRKGGLNSGPAAVLDGAHVARNAGGGWIRRHIPVLVFCAFVAYAVVSRLISEGGSRDL